MWRTFLCVVGLGVSLAAFADDQRALTYCFEDAAALELPDDVAEKLPAAYGSGGLSVRPIGPADVEIWRGHSRLTRCI